MSGVRTNPYFVGSRVRVSETYFKILFLGSECINGVGIGIMRVNTRTDTKFTMMKGTNITL